MSRHRPQLLTIAAIFLASFSASCSQKPAEAPAAPPDTRAADDPHRRHRLGQGRRRERSR
jgi:hypothetical protein